MGTETILRMKLNREYTFKKGKYMSANWCDTRYSFYGEKFELEDFSRKLTASINRDEDSESDGCWLSNVLIGFGFATKEDIEHDKVKIGYRGWVYYNASNVKRDKIGHFVQIDTKTAWVPMNDLWDAIIAKYKTLKYVFMAEEPSYRYYENSDKKGRFFSYRYKLDICCNDLDEKTLSEFRDKDDCDSTGYFDSRREFNEWIRSTFYNINSMKKFKKFAANIRLKFPESYILIDRFL